MQTFAYAVIMAGGRGERFWPVSRSARPKQLLKLLGETTMIEQTVARISPVFSPDHIVIITNVDYVEIIRGLLKDIPPENIIGEPAGRNTAPCVALAAAYIRSISPDPDPCIAFFPADHAIRAEDAFREVVSDCITWTTQENCIVTIGIIPVYPATGYGYIELGKGLETPLKTPFHEGKSFREKPDSGTAEKYVISGRYRWNGGMFFMRHSVFLQACREYATFLADFHDIQLTAFQKNDMALLKSSYESVQKISIDYAIMEKARNIAVAESRFDWDDVGAWSSVRNQLPSDGNGNVVRSKLFAGTDTRDCVIFNTDDNHLVTAVGMTGTVIVHTPDATFVCPEKYVQRITELMKLLHSDSRFTPFL